MEQLERGFFLGAHTKLIKFSLDFLAKTLQVNHHLTCDVTLFNKSVLIQIRDIENNLMILC